LFYKGQKAVYFLLPTADDYVTQLGKRIIIVCFVSKLIEILLRLYEQINCDLFFVDWEKPRNDVERQLSVTEEPHSGLNVSVWRKIIACNKWNDLQTVRVIHVPLTLFFVIFLLNGLNLQYLATSQPSFNLERTAPIHPILLFAVSTFLLLVITILQYAYTNYVYDIYFENALYEFIDLLSLSNISLLIFDSNYHYFYIHGKSTHPSADVNHETMLEILENEEKTITKQRGLSGTNKDAFSVYVTKEWRAHWEKEYTALVKRQLTMRRRKLRQINRRSLMDQGIDQREWQARHGNTRINQQLTSNNQNPNDNNIIDTSAVIHDRLLRANAVLNNFVCNFIDKHLNSYTYEMSENSFWRKLLKLPVFLPDPMPNTIFFDDNREKDFRSTLLCGIEVDLILLMIFLFEMCVYIWKNVLVAVLVCYIVDRIIVALRKYYGEINIARKTLIDERFLI